jgi:hypothetical protein
MQTLQILLGAVFILISFGIIAPDLYRIILQYNNRTEKVNRKWTDPKETKHADPSARSALLNYDTKSSRRSDTSKFFKDN